MRKNFFAFSFCILIFSWLPSKCQVISTFAGDGILGYITEGSSATATHILPPSTITSDANGNIYIGMSSLGPSNVGAKVLKVTATGIITTFAGIDTIGFSGDGGPATAARLTIPDALAFDKKGNLYIADMYVTRRIRKVSGAGTISTIAGNGSSMVSGDGGPATAAGIGNGAGMCIDSMDNIYIAAGNKIRKVDTFGIISTIAGTGSSVFSGDGGPATAAGIITNGQIILDGHGNMFIADGFSRIRRINSAGIITTITGNSAKGFSGDGGLATAAQLYNPTGVYVDKCDNIYIGDSWNQRIRMIDNTGIIKTIAGNGFGQGTSVGGYSGDGGPATIAELNTPGYLWIDNNDRLYIPELVYRVRYMHVDTCVVSHVGIPVTSAQEQSLHIFPNPSYGSFTLHLSSPTNEQVHVQVTDLTGRLVKELHCTKDTEVRIERPGLYFVTTEVNGRRYVQKVMVE